MKYYLVEVVGVRVEMPSNQPIVLLKEVEGLSLDFISYSKLVTHALRDYADFGRKFDAEDFSAHWERLASELENYLQST